MRPTAKKLPDSVTECDSCGDSARPAGRIEINVRLLNEGMPTLCMGCAWELRQEIKRAMR